MKNLVTILLLGFLASSTWGDFKVPPLQSHVTDQAQILSKATENRLNSVLTRVKVDTGIEMAILTLKSLEGLPIEQASIQIVDQWKLGTAKDDKGLLLLLSTGDRRIRIEVGQGLEGTLTDAASNRIINQTLTPLLRTGQYNEAVLLATFQMLSQAAPDQDFQKYFDGIKASRNPNQSPAGRAFSILFLIVLILLISRGGFLPLLLLGGGRGYHGYGGGGGFGGGFGGGGGFSGGGASGGW